ncbi:MAG TPA: efflux RND transporter periplasmic adaptor subunit [Gemmata sp.]|nr:efflux RND transporter periplasmic adaptor subunit [Gemmata sp.]
MRHAVGLTPLLCAAVLAGCAKPPVAKRDTPPAPVTVATVATKTVPVRVRAIGTVKTAASVAIRPRVGGELTGVFFDEGNIVKADQKLFTIDPRPYKAASEQARANKAKSLTLLKGAELNLKRAEDAKASGVGAPTEYDAALTAVASAKATVEADQAAIDAAELQVAFTTIRSPIHGRAGELLVNRGNLVDANGVSPLVVINQVSPIHVTFTLPEQQLPVVLAARRRGPLKVEADPRTGGPPATGVLEFVDNAADPLTGTVAFKAVFKNADERLWPGVFVDVILTLGERPDSPVVPSAALQAGQNGQYVYVVTAEGKAEMRPVTVAFEADGEEVIASGLRGGELVVVEGQLRLAPGARVDAKPYRPQSGPAGPTPTPSVTAGGVR